MLASATPIRQPTFASIVQAVCVDDKFIKMPEYALANDLWLGRERTALQNGTLGLRMLLSIGRQCFRKLLLGKSHKDTSQ